MEYLIGVVLGAVVAALGVFVGFDRDRSFYPTVLIVIGAYYALFALLAPPPAEPLVAEVAVGCVFLVVAVIGYKRSPMLVAAGMAGHGVFDFFHHRLIDNPGVSVWWPGFCMTIDVALGVWLWALTRRRASRSGAI